MSVIFDNAAAGGGGVVVCQAPVISGTSQQQSMSVTFDSSAGAVPLSHAAAPQFPVVVDPLTQAAVAQVGAVYQAAAAAAYKAVAASGLVPNLSQDVLPSLSAQPTQPLGCMFDQTAVDQGCCIEIDWQSSSLW